MKPDTPEDRLLNLIKGKYKKKSAGQGAGQKQGNPFVSDIIRKFILDNKVFKSSYLNMLNIALLAVLAILLIALAYTFLVPPKNDIAAIIGDGTAVRPATDATDVKQGSQADGVPGDVMASLEGKDIFGLKASKDGASAGQLADADLTKRFTLVGIMEGADPQAIIEDIQAQKTYYLIKGQSVGGITIDEINPGKVVLTFEGKQVILVL